MNKVKLVSITPDAEETIAYIARVSNPKNQENEKYEGLLKYMIKHGHWSPFEQAYMTIEIQTSLAIATQILRHRSFTYQQFSQRYAEKNLINESIDLPELRRQDTKNRQNSIEINNPLLQDQWNAMQQRVIDHSKLAYDWAIENGIAKEQARVVLPEGNTKTRLYMNGTLRSWIHYIDLRGDNGTQKEHMEIAHACAKVISEIFPLMDDL